MDSGCGKSVRHAQVGCVSERGQHSLKDAYQYMESKVVKGTGNREAEVSPALDKLILLVLMKQGIIRHLHQLTRRLNLKE